MSDVNENSNSWKNIAIALVNFLFSGVGILVLQVLWGVIKKYATVNNVINALVRESIVFLIILIIIIFNWYKQNKKQEKLINSLQKRIEDVNAYADELRNTNDELDMQNIILNYHCDKYERLDDFYKKLSSIVDLNCEMNESVIANFIKQIEQIVLDTVSGVKEKIYVSIFEERTNNKFSVYMSNYHTEGTIKNLQLNRKSFVAKVFRKKEKLYIENISERKSDVAFVERDGRTYETILGIPYIVNDKCKMAIVIKTKYAGALAEVNDKYLNLLNRYTQVIGHLMIMKSYVEVKKDA